jgi:hypothetical protein
MAGLITQQSLGNDQYPRTIAEATSVLSNHQFDFSTLKPKNPNNKNKTEKKPNKQINLTFAQVEGRCYCCGKQGHLSPQCKDKNKPREEWFINQDQKIKASLLQASQSKNKVKKSTTPRDTYKEPTQSESVGWGGLHHHIHQQDNMKKWILLDNESTVTIFCNPDLVEDIQDMKNKSLDLVTNAGILRMTQKATIPGWGRAWYNEEAKTNIFSYAEIAKKH